MTLVVGATGRLGSEICRRLAAKGKPFKALVRESSDPSMINVLKEYGAEIVPGDLKDRSSLEPACQGITTVISTVSAMPASYQPEENNIQKVDIEGVTNLIETAKAAGVKHFIYTSFSGQIDLDFPLRNAKRTMEQRLKDSGLTYTILRPSYFMEAWLGPAVGFDYSDAKARIYGTGENPISWISVQDVVEFAIASLENPAAQNSTLEMGGPEALSPLQVIRIFEEAGGQSFEVEHVPVEALEEQQRGATDPMQQSFAALMRCYAQGDAIDMQATLKAFPLQLTSVRDYAKRVLSAS